MNMPSGRVFVGRLVDLQTADGLVDRLQDESPVLGEEVAVDVLGRLDLAVPHLVRDLHVARPGRDEQGGADVPQLVRGVGDRAVLVRGCVPVGQCKVLAPGRVSEVTAPVAVDQPCIPLAVAAPRSKPPASPEPIPSATPMRPATTSP